jgi:transposase
MAIPGLPIAIHVSSASPHESQLVEPKLDARFVADEPKRLIGDRAYDSDPLDAALAKRGIEMTAPHRSNRTAPKTQDGRSLRRYKRRWKIERLNRWLLSYRRVAVRYERKVENYVGFVHLACIRILLRHVFFEMSSKSPVRRIFTARLHHTTPPERIGVHSRPGAKAWVGDSSAVAYYRFAFASSIACCCVDKTASDRLLPGRSACR